MNNILQTHLLPKMIYPVCFASKTFFTPCQGTPSLWSIFFYRNAWAWNSSLFTTVCAFYEALFEFQLQTLFLSVSCTFLGLFSLNSCNFKCWSSHLQTNGKYSVHCCEKAVKGMSPKELLVKVRKWKRRYERHKCCWVILLFTLEVQKFTK